MRHTKQITAALKKCLKGKGITYALLARELRLSEASVKRIFAESSFTLKRLEQICEILELDFYELAKMSRPQANVGSELSLEQETALAKDPKLLTVFHLLLNDYRAKDISHEYVISETETIKLLNKLDRLGLIELHPNNAVKLLVSRHFSWRAEGPMRTLYDPQVMKEFFNSKFADKTEALRFEVKELSAASLAVIRRKIDRLAKEFEELAEIDAALPTKERQSAAVILAIRPWVFSVVSGLKRKTAPGETIRTVASKLRV